jgi:hypothetical protein
MSLRKPGRGTRAPHGRGIPVQCALAGMRTRIGSPGARVCIAVRRNGEPCGALALKGVSRCQYHGGFGMLALARAHERRRKARASEGASRGD